MDGFTSKAIGRLALLAGTAGVLAILTLVLFFVGLFQNIAALASLGSVNDTLNAIFSLLSAVLASVLYPALLRFVPRLSLILLIAAWGGAIAVVYGSWLIITGRSDVELSSYYFFFGNGLIGIWLLAANRMARQQNAWPRSLTLWGSIAAAFLMWGLLALYGIVMRWDGDMFSLLLLVMGVGYLGIGILYPIWCLRLGRWILAGRAQDTLVSSTTASASPRIRRSG